MISSVGTGQTQTLFPSQGTGGSSANEPPGELQDETGSTGPGEVTRGRTSLRLASSAATPVATHQRAGPRSKEDG